jgi:transposase
MLSVADGAQQGLFDARWCGQVVAADSFYGLLAEHGHRIVSDRDFAACYSERRGRPSIPPSHLAKILLLAYREGASDEQAMERLRYDLRWKVAVGVALDHPGYHPTSLVKFRARLLLHGMERLALERSVALATELGLMEGSAEQIVDSTPMLGAAATQDTVRLVRSGVARLIGALSGADPEAADQLRRALAFDYEHPRRKPECDWRRKAARERMLTEVAQDARRALRAIGAEPDLAGDPKVAEALSLLGDLVGQDFEIDEDDTPRLRREVAHGRILSVVDPEMRHGRKSAHQRFDGYKIHAAATGDGRLISALEVSPGGDRDGAHAVALIDTQPGRLRPTRLLGDTAYGDQVTRAGLAERAVEVLAPVPESRPRPGRLGKRDFHIDLGAGTVSCPGGRTQPISARPRASGERSATFRAGGCSGCALTGSCLDTRGHRGIVIEPREDLLLAGIAAMADPHEREGHRRRRPRVERLLSLLAHRYHARKSRYFGRRKALLQAAWSAALVNLNPIATAIRAEAT